MRLENYEFFIIDGMTATPVAPVIPTLAFKDQPDPDFGFSRRVLETPLIFKGEDYLLMLSYEQAGCGPLTFEVRYLGDAVYMGVVRFGTSKVAVDLVNCVIEVQVDPMDAYTCLVEEWDEERNIFIGTSRQTAGTFLGTLYTETCEALYPSLLDGREAGPVDGCLTGPVSGYALLNWSVEENNSLPPPDQFQSRAVWAQERIDWPCDGTTPAPPPGGGWTLVTDNCVGLGTALWGRPAPLRFLGVVDEEDRYIEAWEIVGGPAGQMRNGVTLASILNLWAPCGLDVVSDFFGIDPDGTHPANGAYTSALANLQSVLLYQKSDVKRPTAGQPASIGNWTLRGLLSALQAQFDVQPRVIGNTLRIEHRTFWEAGPGLDLTGPPFEALVARHLRYTYDDQALARRERWQFMEEVSPRFLGLPIRYTSCIPEGIEPERVYQIERTNNDIAFIQANPDLVGDDGFTFAAAVVVAGDWFLLSELVIGVGAGMAVNGHLAIPNLLDKYHRSGRMLPTGILNGNPVTFDSARARRVQEQFTVLLPRGEYHADFDGGELVVTALGGGEVRSAEYDAASRALTLELAYPQ